MKNKKFILYIIIAVLLLAIVGYFLVGKAVWSPNFKTKGANFQLFIPAEATIDDIVNVLKDSSVLVNETSFVSVAKFMGYTDDNIRAGRYIIKNDAANREVISKLRSGEQDAQKVVINNIRTIYDLSGKASKYFEADSLSFLSYLTDPSISDSYGFNQETFLTMFIPNTYEMFWTATPEKFVKRMKKEYDTFWTAEKISKLKISNLNQTEAFILASIVEKESNYDPERPTIAGVYINRLMTGERLRADPTVVFALGDFTIQRVLYSHLTFESPYNTYLHEGLPPGPICMPSISSLNAVINAEKHEYMFFCAKADNSGLHAFAKDYDEHLKNAAAFSKWLNSLNIR